MSLLAFVIPAVLGLWMLGAYNRLIRLRNVIASVFAAFAAQARERAELIGALLALAGKLLPGDSPLVDNAARAAQLSAAALDVARLRPVRHDVVAEFGRSDHALGRAMLALSEALRDHVGYADTQADPEAHQHPVVTQLGSLETAQTQTDYARLTYNLAATEYNEAIRLFPTTLVAAVFGFGPAALLPAAARGTGESSR
jgi:LemA protein